ncbi:MAG: DUF1934 domain-containing protein [Mogibacterium sp.]|nr:DUF1934 domain-containing protein [Mogibacterium sp.]
MQKKNITLKISNKQYAESLQPRGEAFARELNLEDQFEIFTEGTMYTRAGATYLSYEESEEAGLENNRTIIKIAGQTMNVRRFGEQDETTMDLHLEQGAMNITRYHVPMGQFDLEVFTNEIKRETDEEGYGTIFADYNIRMEPLFSRRNKLTIEVLPS